MMLDALNHVLFVVGTDHVTVAELLGFVTGAACVWLTVKADIWNFPVGLANCAFFAVLFLSARLYADASLQAVFFALGVAGWWQWLHGGANRGPLEVSRAPLAELAALAGLVALSTWGLTVLLTSAHDTAPFWDALTTALALAAQWLLNTKRVETWFFWIAADVVYIPLYGVKHLWLTSLVYVLFLALCLRGLRDWRGLLPRSRVEQVAVTT